MNATTRITIPLFTPTLDGKPVCWTDVEILDGDPTARGLGFRGHVRGPDGARYRVDGAPCGASCNCAATVTLASDAPPVVPVTRLPWHINAVTANKVVGDENTKAEKYLVSGANATVATFYRQADAIAFRAMMDAFAATHPADR